MDITVTATNGNVKKFKNVESIEFWENEQGALVLYPEDEEMEMASYIGSHVKHFEVTCS